MSGDSEVGEGKFEMAGGALVSENGGVFYTTNTDSEFTLKNVSIQTADDCEYLLRVIGNQNARGWGQIGSNGANCTFTAIEQALNGKVVWDSISNPDMTLSEGSVLTGAIEEDESCAGEGGSGTCNLAIDESSKWIATGDSVLTTLVCKGTIEDASGKTVTIQDSNGNVLVQGESEWTIAAKPTKRKKSTTRSTGGYDFWQNVAVHSVNVANWDAVSVRENNGARAGVDSLDRARDWNIRAAVLARIGDEYRKRCFRSIEFGKRAQARIEFRELVRAQFDARQRFARRFSQCAIQTAQRGKRQKLRGAIVHRHRRMLF